MNIRIINDRVLWNNFIAQQPGASQLHTFEWSEAQHLLGHITYRLGAFEGEQLVGTMILVIRNLPTSLLDVKHITCTQRSNATGGNLDVLAALLAEAHLIARRERAVMFRFQPNLPLPDMQLQSWLDSTKPSGVTIMTTDNQDRYHPVYDYVYRPPLYRLWSFATRLRRQQPQKQLPAARTHTVPLHAL